MVSSDIPSRSGLEFFLPESIDGAVSVIEVGPFQEDGLAKEINNFLGTGIQTLNRINTYLLVTADNLGISESFLQGKPFVDPIIHRATLDESLALQLDLPFDYVIQSMLRPGTSDAEGTVALNQAMLALSRELSADDIGFYSKQYFLQSREITQKQLREVTDFLANPELNTSLILERKEYMQGHRVQVPVVTLKPEIKVEKYAVADMSDDELLALNKDRKLAATLEELRLFTDLYRDEEFIKKRREVGLDERATDVELETWFGLRSEHCFHKEFNARITLEDKVNDPIFKRAFDKGWLTKNEKGLYVLEDGIFKTFIEQSAKVIYDKLKKRGRNWIASMFKDNSGVVFYDENYMFCIKIETHNQPSNKEPIQGAKTGIDGVLRDIIGTILGTFNAIANFFLYCTGNIDYKGWLPKDVKHPYTILKGITAGVRQGGNEMQIPTLGGGLITDPRFITKSLVHCGTVGWSPVKSPEGIDYTKKHPSVGDIVLVAGQAVGIDGVHGATESSLIADENISLGHVQADFSFIQAKMKEYILEVARGNLLSSITDFGAMGLGSAALETAEATGGLELDLALHPKKYAGIQPWQIIASETQDRMLLVSKPENVNEILERAKLHDVDVTVLGTLTDTGFVNLTYDGDTVALIDIKKLFDKNPRKEMKAVWRGNSQKSDIEIEGSYTLEQSLNMVLARPDVASKEWFFRQKDSSVKGATIQGPLMGMNQEVAADVTLQKPLDTEGYDYGAIAYSLGISPKLSDISPYHSAQKAFVDMVGKIIAIGGELPDMDNAKWDAWAVCGNYCQPNSDSETTLVRESGEHNLASLLLEGIGVADAVETLNIPVISGKDSMKCTRVCDLNLDDFLINSDSEFAKEYAGLSDEVREDLDKVKEHFGDRYDSDLIDSIIFEAIPVDLRRHVAISEKKKTLKDKKTKEEYEVLVKAIEIHDPDSYLASAAVKIQDYRKTVSSSFKKTGDLVYIVGTTKDHLGGSAYLEAIGYHEQGAPIEGGKAPEIDFVEFTRAAGKLHSAIDGELVASSSYLEHGLGIGAAKAAMAGDNGVTLNLEDVKYEGETHTNEDIIFSQTPGRFMVSIAPENKKKFEKVMGRDASMIGEVTNNNLSFKGMNGSTNFVYGKTLKESYQQPLRFDLDVAVK